MGLKIVSTASYAPSRIVTNDELSTMMDTSDKWISLRTGIKRRHIAQKELTSDLALKVAECLLEKANISVNQIDFIIVATMTPDYMTPSVAATVQGHLGTNHAFAFDVNAACSGFVYALAVANKLLLGSYKRGLVIGAETVSKLVDWQDRSTAVLFGDGSGGVLVEREKESDGIVAEDLECFGKDAQNLTAGYIPTNSVFNHDLTDDHKKYFEMNGRAVYKFATKEVPNSINRVLRLAKWQKPEITWFFLHQANNRILTTIARSLGQEKTKFLSNIDRFGNTSAASIAILLDEAVSNGKVRRGQKLILSGFGGGLTVASIALIF